MKVTRIDPKVLQFPVGEIQIDSVRKSFGASS